MKTRLSLISRENAELEAELAPEDLETLQQIMKYFSFYPLSAMDAQIIRKDLIGMAWEGRLRGETLRDMLGDDMESLCESVLDNSPTLSCKWRSFQCRDGFRRAY